MAISIARVHLKMAHAALPALLPTPPKWKMLPALHTQPCPCVAAAILPKQLANKPSRADSDERWDAHKTMSSGPRFADRSMAGHGSPRKNATSPPPMLGGRADAVERWDAHKKAARPASSSSSSSVSSSLASSSKCSISGATSAERWNAHKKRHPPQTDHQRLDDDGESSSTCSNDDNDDTEDEEIVWQPRGMYTGPGFAGAAPESSMLPMPTAFLVHVA